MNITGTREAFSKLVNEAGFAKRHGFNKSAVSLWKTRLESGENITLDKMEEILLKCGATVVGEKTWHIDLPNTKP